ncbi:MAG: type II toxin-antitoxin system RelE/ParE family toxin [Nanoarchaeota archaeon]
MVEVRFDKKFIFIFSKIKDNLFKLKVTKQIKKMVKNPEIGKPMKYIRKGTREIYIKPYRLSYEYNEKDKIIYVWELYHKKFQ